MLFDTHAHYDDEAFDPDRELLLESLPQRGGGSQRIAQHTLHHRTGGGQHRADQHGGQHPGQTDIPDGSDMFGLPAAEKHPKNLQRAQADGADAHVQQRRRQRHQQGQGQGGPLAPDVAVILPQVCLRIVHACFTSLFHADC